ncbi:MAG TPA: BamA/TamA family outer membrane protein [Pirellulales bacterium]|jgi:outer membrane protein insertion porin family|nr:BamA/TamA family outer membrane protein [Pirellulales bacterium]
MRYFVRSIAAGCLATLVGCAANNVNGPYGPQPWAGQSVQAGYPNAAASPNGAAHEGSSVVGSAAAAPTYRGQAPAYGGTAVNPVSPQEQSQIVAAPAASYAQTPYTQPGAAPAYTPAAPSSFPTLPQSNFGAPAQYGAPAGYGAPNVPPTTAVIPPTYPPQSNIYAANPAAQGPPGLRTAYAGPPPSPGLYDPLQRAYPGDLLTPEGMTNPLDNVRPLDLDTYVNETQTGKLMFGVGVNSDSGLVGQIVLDEQNFDWTRFPTSWEDIRNGTAFRGNGERFRLEAAPGVEVSRYLVSWQNPYFLDSPVSLRLSGSYFTRIYTDWTEQRAGGRVGLGYLFTPDLSGNFSFRGEEVDLSNPTIPTPPELQAALGRSELYGFGYSLTHDTRDSSFLPTEGHLLDAGFEEVIGTYVYPRVNLDARQYFTLTERPDGSGRHILGLTGHAGWTGSNTPIYEHYFAGGSSSLRGFEFRGVGPKDLNVEVGGDFELLGSVEYLFPITADDMLRGVFFSDFGTVEDKIRLDAETFRVSLGFGLRISIPAMGQAPIALDFAVPVHMLHNSDEVQNFSFTVGFSR